MLTLPVSAAELRPPLAPVARPVSAWRAVEAVRRVIVTGGIVHAPSGLYTVGRYGVSGCFAVLAHTWRADIGLERIGIGDAPGMMFGEGAARAFVAAVGPESAYQGAARHL